MQLPQIQINKEGYYIRELKLTDADAYHALLLHPQVKPFIPEQLLPKSLFDTIRLLTSLKTSSHYWAICTPDNKLIGAAGFENWNKFHKRLEVAFELHPDHQGKGIMTHSLLPIIEYGFKELEAVRIEAFTLTYNKPSIKLLERLGFEHEAELKKYRMFNGKIHNIHLFSLTK